MDNDDLDVTKGCEISVTISSNISDLKLNPTSHNPQIFHYQTNQIKIFAGEGVGVITKKGLKIPPNLPAINPTPLQAIENIFQKLTKKHQNLKIICTISVKNGQTIAFQTANEKVGVIGGISILGTTGFVKPISNSAYLDSIKTEIEFAKANGYDQIVLTLGNSSFIHAKKLYNQSSIVEIGNFIYEAIEIASNAGFKKAIFICGIGKLVKVSQGAKNTHNRFGSINFEALKKYIHEEFNIQIDLDRIKTVKGVVEYLDSIDLKYPQIFHNKIKNDAIYIFREWNKKINVKIIQI
jgi:cobalt-precorrin-5B (C1)-methyltransferase